MQSVLLCISLCRTRLLSERLPQYKMSSSYIYSYVDWGLTHSSGLKKPTCLFYLDKPPHYYSTPSRQTNVFINLSLSRRPIKKHMNIQQMIFTCKHAYINRQNVRVTNIHEKWNTVTLKTLVFILLN